MEEPYVVHNFRRREFSIQFIWFLSTLLHETVWCYEESLVCDIARLTLFTLKISTHAWCLQTRNMNTQPIQSKWSFVKLPKNEHIIFVAKPVYELEPTSTACIIRCRLNQFNFQQICLAILCMSKKIRTFLSNNIIFIIEWSDNFLSYILQPLYFQQRDISKL